jgi:hypothetical protein
MQDDLRRRVAIAPKDKHGFPRLYVCPITGVHQIVRTEKQLREAQRVPWYGLAGGIAVAAVLFVVFF